MALLDGWTNCPRCTAELTRREASVECSACGFVLYSHSAVTASALPADDEGRVLLARRGIEPFLGRWDAVGGFVHEGEHPLDAVRREVQEETGLDFEADQLLGIWMGSYGEDERATLNLFWTGRLGDGRAEPADDVAELRWFSARELPSGQSLAFDGLIDQALAAWRHQHA